MVEDDPFPPWVERLCRAVTRRSEQSVIEMFRSAGADVANSRFDALVAQRLRSEPELIGLWETFSADNRGTPASYFVGLEVGYYDGRRLDVRRHSNAAAACADLIHRRVVEVLTGRRLAKD